MLVVVFMVLVIVLFMVLASRSRGCFTDKPSISAEKVKNILVYLGITAIRSPVGQWTQEDQHALAALQALILPPTTSTQIGIYYAQAVLQRAGGYSGRIDGVTSDAFTSARSKFITQLDPAALELARTLCTYNGTPSLLSP